MQTVHAQYLLFTCTGLMHHWTIGYMLHCFQVEHVEDGQLRVLLPKEKKEWYFCKQRAFLFLTQKQFQNRKDFRFGPADVFLQLAFSQPPHNHPPFPLLNKPSSSSSSHSTTFYLCCTWEMRGGMGAKMNETGSGEWKGVGGGGERRARLGKMPFDWI